ncbi:MAG: hypothetical protein DHS20C16_26820 [Phycisphaerae bacterium]|nr:MAG: hypothetical protein DHS20C16_26820 [Phycisphaerae bacterium]
MKTLTGAILLSLFVALPASAFNFTTPILNHPDGDVNPPPYGLRMDELFTQTPSSGSIVGGVGGITTFSFAPGDGANMTMNVNDLGGDLEINISGVAKGGVDAGGSYGYGEGLFAIDFTYSMNVEGVPGPNGGWKVTPNNVANNGTITALAGNTDITAGTEWTFWDEVNGDNDSFLVVRDEHRLAGHPGILALDPLVGRGWVTYHSNGSGSSGTQDFLFIADTPIPEPTSIMLLAAGCGVLGLRRNRRS